MNPILLKLARIYFSAPKPLPTLMAISTEILLLRLCFIRE